MTDLLQWDPKKRPASAQVAPELYFHSHRNERATLKAAALTLFDFVCPNGFVSSGSQVFLLPRWPGFRHSSADPGAGQTSAAASFTVTTSAAEACATLPAPTPQPALLPLQAPPADPALSCICSRTGSGVPTAHGADARAAAAEAHPEAGAAWGNSTEPSSLHHRQESAEQGEASCVWLSLLLFPVVVWYGGIPSKRGRL